MFHDIQALLIMSQRSHTFLVLFFKFCDKIYNLFRSVLLLFQICFQIILMLPNHFDEYFVPLSSIHYHSTRLATSKNLFLPRVNSSSGKCSLKFIGPKVWSSIPDDIKFSTTFTFQWKLKKHLLHGKNSQLWTLATFPLSRTKYCVF